MRHDSQVPDDVDEVDEDLLIDFSGRHPAVVTDCSSARPTGR